MIQRLSLSAVFALALAASACAREAEPEAAASATSETETEAGAADSAPAAATEMAAAQDAPAGFEFPEEAWRDIDPENTLYIETDHGRVVIELTPEFAPNHVDRMKSLARDGFYDFLVWHRVIDGFMAQGGGSRSNPNHRSDLPNLEAEFTRRRGADTPISELGDRIVNPRSRPIVGKAGFWNSFPAGTQPVAQAGLTADGQVESWLIHCQGAASMARTNDPNSAGSQFYVTRVPTPHLDATYTVWGKVRSGQEAVNAIRVGTMGQDLGFTPDVIRSMRVAADLPEAERTGLQVVDTEHASFSDYLDTLRDEDGALPDVCEIEIPTRTAE